MKKVICLACGLMNLEKFVTFPHCAGCGARLPLAANDSWFERWRRPLRAPLWATFVGLCCAALGFWGITIARETGRDRERQLLAYVEFPREVNFGQTTTVQLTLDTVEADTNTSVPRFYNVRLRLSGASLEKFTFVAVSPMAQLTQEGSGRYFIFDSLGRDEPIQLQLRPRRSGEARLGMVLFVRDFTPFAYQSTMQVIAPGKTSAKTTGAKKISRPVKVKLPNSG